MVHCKAADEFENTFSDMLKSEVVSKYGNIINHLKSLKLRLSEWALSYRKDYLTRGNNTNNYVEASLRIVKDKVLNRTKAFSIVQLFDFLTINYVRKLADVVNNRYEGYTKTIYYIKNEKMSNLVCDILAEDLYRVVSGTNEYVVNHKMEICTCPVGCQGAHCKHQCAVATKYNLSSSNFVPKVNSTAKEILHFIMTGEANKIHGWYNTLQNTQTRNDLPAADCTDSNYCDVGNESNKSVIGPINL